MAQKRKSPQRRKPDHPEQPAPDAWTKWNARFWGFLVPALLCYLLYKDFSDNHTIDNGQVLIPAILFLVAGGTAAEIWKGRS